MQSRRRAEQGGSLPAVFFVPLEFCPGNRRGFTLQNSSLSNWSSCTPRLWNEGRVWKWKEQNRNSSIYLTWSTEYSHHDNASILIIHSGHFESIITSSLNDCWKVKQHFQHHVVIVLHLMWDQQSQQRPQASLPPESSWGSLRRCPSIVSWVGQRLGPDLMSVDKGRNEDQPVKEFYFSLHTTEDQRATF